MDQKHDWEEVVALQPKGYVELNDGKRALHGPIESIEVDDNDFVNIKLKWTASVALGEHGAPVSAEWDAVPDNPPIVFPNLVVPYVIEDTPNKGRRVRFGFNMLYLKEIAGLDPAKVRGLTVA